MPRILPPLLVALLIHWSLWKETAHWAPGQTGRRWLPLFRQHFYFPFARTVTMEMHRMHCLPNIKEAEGLVFSLS